MGFISPWYWTGCEVAKVALKPIVCYACAQKVKFDPGGLPLSWAWVGYVRWVCSRDCQKAVIAQTALEGLVHELDPGAVPEVDDAVSVQRASDYRRPDYE